MYYTCILSRYFFPRTLLTKYWKFFPLVVRDCFLSLYCSPQLPKSDAIGAKMQLLGPLVVGKPNLCS